MTNVLFLTETTKWQKFYTNKKQNNALGKNKTAF